MRRAIAVLGIAGLGAACGIASAAAAPATTPPGALICHFTESGTYEPFFVSSHGMIHDLNGHGSHSRDIIPFPGFGGSPTGQNMTPENVAIYNNGCVQPEAAPAGPASPVPSAPPEGVPASNGMNVGYNVDGAVPGQSPYPGPGNDVRIWLGGTSALLAAVGAWTVWRARFRGKGTAG